MTRPFNLKEYLLCMLEIPPLGADDLEIALEARADGCDWARRLLQERYLPHVVGWVMPYRSPSLGLETLIKLGNRALLKGLRQLKPGVLDATDFLEQCVVSGVEASLSIER